LIRTDADTGAYLAAAGYPVGGERVDQDILAALDFIDDPLWCAQQRGALELDEVSLQTTSEGQAVSVRLNVQGIHHPLYDPRIPALVVATRKYRKTDAIAICDPTHDWRIVVATGQPVAYLADINAPLLESERIDADTIDVIAAANGVLADLFPADARVA
jgi:hypothetical protein